MPVMLIDFASSNFIALHYVRYILRLGDDELILLGGVTRLEDKVSRDTSGGITRQSASITH